MKYIYLYKLREFYSNTWAEIDLVFKSSAQLWLYLYEQWSYWEQTLSQEDFERIPPIPDISEIRAGLNTSNSMFPTYEIVSIGFVNYDDPLSILLYVKRMPIY